MATTIVEKIDESNKQSFKEGKVVTREKIEALSHNMEKRMMITEDTNPSPASRHRSINCSILGGDSKTVYFDRKDVEALLAAHDHTNDKCNGLMIFFGVHDHDGIMRTRDKERYNNKLMVVLAGAKDEKPKILVNDKVEIAGVNDINGLDNGKLCPPDKSCPSN
jgi:hypothetical protein